MIPAADFSDSSSTPDQGNAQAGEQLDKLSYIGSNLGVELVDISAALDQIDDSTGNQLQSLEQVRGNANRMLEGNASVRAAIETVNETTVETLDAVVTAVENIQSAGNRTQKLASWVQSLDARITLIENSNQSAQSNNEDIASIAKQVNILAINAKIVAASAGETGRAFAVIAEAINELAHKTTEAAEGNNESNTILGNWIETLRNEVSVAADDAKAVLNEADETDISLSGIAEHVRMINFEAMQIKTNAGNVGDAIGEFGRNFDQMGVALEQTAVGIHQVRDRASKMVEQSECLIQSSVSLGGITADTKFINEVQARAALISAVFDAAIANGAISTGALFSRNYTPIHNSNPQQVMAGFTAFTDKILPDIQEPALKFDPRIVFCAAIDLNGYIPTHNNKFSQSMGNDPVWNTANCRNRRIFNDTVGLKAANNKEPFLLQIYRRDMGGGNFITMKDISAPIFINGKHWGGLRLAYTTQ